jgi:protein tyrosine kinase modulator
VATAEQSFDLSQVWSAVRRRALPAFITFFAIAAAAIAAAFVWPPTYSSSGTILIEQQELPSDLVRSTVSTYASQRIQQIAQRVMTTENLMGIIQRYNLYPDLRKSKPREEVVATMRKATDLQMISADVIDPRNGQPTKATIAFSLTYSNRFPQLAAQVANELVSLYLQQNIEARQKSTKDAVTFLQSESSRLSQDIDAQQVKIAAFKRQNENDLPELSQLNLTDLNQTQNQILETDTQIQSLEQQLIFLDSQLAQINPTAQVYDSTGQRVQSPEDLLRSLRSQYARDSALYAPDFPDVVREKREIAALEKSNGDKPESATNDYRRQLEDARTQLADAKHRYAPDHPDVIRLQKLVDSLQKNVQDASKTAGGGAVSGAATGTANGAANTDAANLGADNPTYVQLRTQREAGINEKKALEDKRAALQARYDDYERRLARTPAVEREYAEMMRDLSSAQTQYAQIRQKLMEADIADNLETERKGERFALIEPPLVPEEPASPNRSLIVVFGLIAAFALSLATVLLLESIDGSVRSRQDLQQLVSVPPLAIIPIMLTSIDCAARRRRRWYALGGTAGTLVLAVIAVHLFYRPLDVLWAIALRHLGVQT